MGVVCQRVTALVAAGRSAKQDGRSVVNLCFKVTLAAGVEVAWETILVDARRLYVEIPAGILPDGSRERCGQRSVSVTLLMLLADCRPGDAGIVLIGRFGEDVLHNAPIVED